MPPLTACPARSNSSRTATTFSTARNRKSYTYLYISILCTSQLTCFFSCRRSDQASKSTYHSYNSTTDYSSSRNNSYASDASEPKDIIPQASPSRPGSMIFASSPPATPGNHYHESAVSALRSLSHARRPPSPPSPTTTTGFWPFGKGAAPSPSASYVRPSAGYLSSSNYDAGYYGGSGGFTYSGPTDHRPLPSRSSRPKSVELVTPIIGR